jgi:hypothetical protein
VGASHRRSSKRILTSMNLIGISADFVGI